MKGDFLGFSFGGIHSDDLGIVRVSGGDRFEEQLHPEINDITAEVPGMDGVYYFGSTYGTKEINLEFAFDSLTEEQFRELRQVFGTKEIKKLIFDERPYKYYMVKIKDPIELSYICFDEPKKVETVIEGIRYIEDGVISTSHTVMRPNGEIQRIYKGEGKISFISYFPFARSVYKQIPSEEEGKDWVISSGILSELEFEERKFDFYDNTYGIINIYNPGDLSTGFRLYCPFTNGIIESMTINYCKKEEIDDNEIETILCSLKLNQISVQENDSGILIDTNIGIIQGVIINNAEMIPTKHIYNQYIESGYLFKLEPNTLDENMYIQIVQTTLTDNIKIFYDYLYF